MSWIPIQFSYILLQVIHMLLVICKYIQLFLLFAVYTNTSSILLAVSAVNTTSTTTTTSTQNPAALSYSPRPADVTVTVGTPAVFLCGVPKASPNLTFTFYGSHRNYELICPYGHMKEISQVR